MNEVFKRWQRSLSLLLELFLFYRHQTKHFYLKLFLFFVALNITCYWFGMFSVFSSYMETHEKMEYVLIQFPVGILGGLFDTFSLFVTIWIVERAIKLKSFGEYVAHLSIDVVIAILATFWVLFVFMISGWLVSQVLQVEETLDTRTVKYQMRVVQAVQEPTASWRNIYFGLVMGISAMLPTAIHLFMFFKSSWKVFRKRVLVKAE